jgi:hypothetical protein
LPADWVAAPACRQQPLSGAASSTSDSSGRLWGWEDGRSCAYKDASGQPIYSLRYKVHKRHSVIGRFGHVG